MFLSILQNNSAASNVGYFIGQVTFYVLVALAIWGVIKLIQKIKK